MKTRFIHYSRRDLYIWPCVAALALAVVVAQAAMALRTALVKGRATRPVRVARAEGLVRAERPSAEASEETRAASRDLSELLIDAIVEVESAGNPGQVGKAGERGLMQIKSGTWAQVSKRLYGRPISFDRAFEPGLNRRIGRGYLAQLQSFLEDRRDEWRADERSLLLACYNAGPGRVLEAGFDLGRVPAPTRDYVARVTALHDLYISRARPGVRDLAAAGGTAGRAASGGGADGGIGS